MHVRARAPRRTRLPRYVAVAAGAGGDGNSVVFAEALCEDVPLLLLLEFPRRRRNLEGVNLSGAWEGGVVGEPSINDIHTEGDGWSTKEQI